MKNYLTVIAIGLFAFQSFGQENLKHCSSRNLMEDDLTFNTFQFQRHAFAIKGEHADAFVKQLREQNKNNQFKFRTKIKNASIPNLTERSKIKILEGYHGYSPENRHYYFHIFTSKKNKQEVIANLTENQKLGYMVYIENKEFSREDRKSNSKSIRDFANGIYDYVN